MENLQKTLLVMQCTLGHFSCRCLLCRLQHPHCLHMHCLVRHLLCTCLVHRFTEVQYLVLLVWKVQDMVRRHHLEFGMHSRLQTQDGGVLHSPQGQRSSFHSPIVPCIKPPDQWHGHRQLHRANSLVHLRRDHPVQQLACQWSNS